MKIKNWNDFQHFKDRNPPWIKLHKNILEQRDIMMISDCSFRILIGLWLLASEDKDKEGKLPEIPDIAFRLRKSENEIIQAIHELESFLIADDIKVISERYQDDDPETETETYSKEAEEEKSIGDFEEFWTMYGKIGNKQRALKAFKKNMKEGVSYENIINGLKRYQNYCRTIGQQQRYIQHASTWLNNKGWEDEYTVHQQGTSSGISPERARMLQELGITE